MSGAKLPIAGLRVSGEMAQINMSAADTPSGLEAFHRLASAHINLKVVTVDTIDGGWSGSCCISAQDLSHAQSALKGLNHRVDLRSPVGTLAVFPHRCRRRLLSRMLAVLEAAAVPVYGLASSLSMLLIVTDYRRLTQAVAAVGQVTQLPPGHSPFKPEISVRQI